MYKKLVWNAVRCTCITEGDTYEEVLILCAVLRSIGKIVRRRFKRSRVKKKYYGRVFQVILAKRYLQIFKRFTHTQYLKIDLYCSPGLGYRLETFKDV